MDSLSPEILTSIISFIDRSDKLAAYATISRKWQPIIERYTFKTLDISSHDFTQFARILSTSHRRSSLTRLDWNILLPPFGEDEELTSDSETEAEQQENNEIFSIRIRELLNILKSWELEFLSVKTARALAIQVSAKSAFGDEWSNQRRFQRSLLQLLGDEKLPVVERPIGFYATSNFPRQVEGASIAKIASAFRNLEQLHLQLYDNEKRNHLVRQQHRYGEFQSPDIELVSNVLSRYGQTARQDLHPVSQMAAIRIRALPDAR